MLFTTSRALLPATCLALLGWTASAPAQSVEEFYKGKTISLVVSSSPGGGYDTLSRASARIHERHAPVEILEIVPPVLKFGRHHDPVRRTKCGDKLRHAVLPERRRMRAFRLEPPGHNGI